MPTFGYKLPYHRYLNLSILMLMYFIMKSCTRCRGICNFDVNGRILGAKCPVYLVSMSQRQIRLLCTSPMALPFRMSSCLPSSSAEGKWPGCCSTFLCSFSSLESLTAAVNQNSLGIEVGQWSQDTGMQTFALFCLAPLSNSNNTSNHNNRNSRVPNHKIPLSKTLLLSVHKKR